jgi:hypothetical protein
MEASPKKEHPGCNQGVNIEPSDNVTAPEKCVSREVPRQDLRGRFIAHTLPYLSTLLCCTEEAAWTQVVTWQTFCDSKDEVKRKDLSLTRVLHGSLDDYGQELEYLNTRGAGIFITINETDRAGRKKSNIVRLRAAWCDIDPKEGAKPFKVSDSPLVPTMVVRSGHGTHLYWVYPSPIPCDERKQNEHEALLRGIQNSLADFGADPKVCQVASVLRVPGFYNMKAEPVLVEVVR